jgi:hypothetical protein
LIRANIDIVRALVEALIERGILTGDQIDIIIARGGGEGACRRARSPGSLESYRKERS